IAAFDAQIETMIQAAGLPPSDPGAAERPASAAPVGPDTPPAAPTEGSSAWAAARVICDAVPGIGQKVAETILAELGCDMSRFPSAAHAASWAGLAPGQHESAGKRRAVRIGKGNRYLKGALIQAAWAAVKQPDTFLAAFYRRLAA